MSVEVSKMIESDLPQVFALTERLSFLNWNLQQFESELKSSCTYGYIAKKDGVFAGYALYHLIADELELLAIATVPELARQGVATRLYQDSVMELQKLGAQTLFLEVREGNASARAFYERQGAVACGMRPRYYHDGETAILYTNKLNCG